jgi:hypothetical protein
MSTPGQRQWADEAVAGLAALLLPLAESSDPMPVTAGPPELPDLVQDMLRLAGEMPEFAASAMRGTDGVSPEQWRLMGRLHLEIGWRCVALATELDRQTTFSENARSDLMGR